MQKQRVNASLEKKYLRQYSFIAGVDEVGVGPLAGPVVAAAVILDPAHVRARRARTWWAAVRDSKALRQQERKSLVKIIFEHAVSVGVGSASVAEIDQLNILQARLLAMKRALDSLKIVPDFVVIDGNRTIPHVTISQQCVIDGDATVLSIACASIVAKVTRDGVLLQLHEQFPQYGFDQHKGYPTKLHRQRLQQYGPCEAHRKSFAPVKMFLPQPDNQYFPTAADVTLTPR